MFESGKDIFFKLSQSLYSQSFVDFQSLKEIAVIFSRLRNVKSAVYVLVFFFIMKYL